MYIIYNLFCSDLEQFTDKSNEAVQNIGNVYADTNNTANFNNIGANNIEIKNDVKIKGKIILSQGNAGNQWAVHTPDDTRKSVFIAPYSKDGTCCDWSNNISINNSGTLTY